MPAPHSYLRNQNVVLKRNTIITRKLFTKTMQKTVKIKHSQPVDNSPHFASLRLLLS